MTMPTTASMVVVSTTFAPRTVRESPIQEHATQRSVALPFGTFFYPKAPSEPRPGDVTTAPLFGPVLLARDFQATLGFYENLLNVPAEGKAPYAKLVTEHSRISIADAKWWSQVSGSEAPLYGEVGLSNVVVVIQVGDVESDFERLAGREIRFLSPPTFRPKMGLKNVILRDPDGRSVMMTSPVG